MYLDGEGLLGPSPRYIVWFHGCSRNCPGCIAIDWNRKNFPAFELSVRTMVEIIQQSGNIEGITISGGEPFLQIDALYDIEDLQELLGIGRTRAYELVKEAYKTQQPFKVIKLGKLYRIPKKPFDDWLEGNT